jgi:hypothetical protein
MTFQDRIRALTMFGFTERQAGFLTMVMLHSGVCLGRQYCAYANIVRGQKMHDLFTFLTVNRFATPYPDGSRITHVYHVQAKPLYAAIGEADNRNRKPITLGRAMERLMLLDAIIDHRDLTWLATEQEKVAHFTRVTQLRDDELPRMTFGQEPHQTIRFFPDKLPVGISAEARDHLFLYVVTRLLPTEFRAFLQRYSQLFRALPSWTMRLLVPQHLRAAQRLYQSAVHQELSEPLRPGTRDELRWFFETRRSSPNLAELMNDSRYRRARRAFGAPRFRRLYQNWLEQGDRVVDTASSPILADAFARGAARVECHVLPHRYHQLSELAGTA